MKCVVSILCFLCGISLLRGQWVVAEAPGSPLDVKTGMIMESAWNMESDVRSMVDLLSQVESHTRNMRLVQEARQRIIMALGQMRLLQDHGVALLRMGPTEAIVNEAEKLWLDPQSEPEPFSMASMPELTSPQSIVEDFKEILEDVKNLFDQGQGLWNAAKGIRTSFSLNPSGILSLMDSGWSLWEDTMQTGSTAAGIYYKVENLVWTGRRFIGANWGQIDHIVGLLGGTIDLDREIPSVMYPTSDRLVAAMRGMAPTSSGSFAKSAFSPESNAAQRIANYQVGNGIYLRKESPLDAAWIALVQQGLGAMAFYAAVTERSGITYDPTVGYFHDGERQSRWNLNNSLSGGRQQAVEDFLTNTKSERPNPFHRLARTVAPILPDLLRRSQPGKAMQLSSEDIRRAEQMGPLALDQFASLAEFPWEWDVQNEGCRISLRSWRRVGVWDHVLIVQPEDKENEEYQAQIAANDVALKGNRRQVHMIAAMLNYSQVALEAATHLRSALQGIAETLTVQTAIESIPLMIQNSDHFIAHLQQMIAWYGLEAGRMEGELHNLLSARAALVRNAREALTQNASLRVSTFLSHGNRKTHQP